jgi:hypothetical protein
MKHLIRLRIASGSADAAQCRYAAWTVNIGTDSTHIRCEVGAVMTGPGWSMVVASHCGIPSSSTCRHSAWSLGGVICLLCAVLSALRPAGDWDPTFIKLVRSPPDVFDLD